MIQLIDSLPFTVDAVDSLKRDWTRFQDGLVILTQIPDAICGKFACEAEIQKADDGDTSEGESEKDDDVSGSDTEELDLESLPSGPGELILTARYNRHSVYTYI